MNDLTVIFTSNSRIEADVVRGLLEAHGLQVILLSEVLQSIFPTNVSHAGAFRLAVRPVDADEARRLIDAHRGAPTGLRVVRIRDEFDSLERRIGYRFRDRGLAEHALTHRSRAHEDASGGVVDNESLEFLGDAVLGFVIADVLFQEFPTYSEGQKSKIKAALVSAPTLAQLGERLSLGDDLLLGRGEEKSGGRRKQALISDAFEAVIAAVYLDGGVDAARTFIVSQFRDLLDEVHRSGVVSASIDYKSALQESLQRYDRGLPEYRLLAEHGPDHRKLFQVEVWVAASPIARAEGRTKKDAEQAAAREALERLLHDRSGVLPEVPDVPKA